MSTRPRHTFKFTSDASHSDSDSDSGSDLDEQSQATLISHLSDSNTTTNHLYTTLFTVLPLASTLVFLFYLFSPSARGSVRLLCLLAITSLGASGAEMWFGGGSFAVTATATMIDDDDDDDSEKRRQRRKARNAKVRRLPFTDVEIDEDGPLMKALPLLNGGICVVLGLAAWVAGSGKGGIPQGFWVVLLLPIVMFGIGAVVRRSMGDVDGGLEELRGLRYGLKGA